MYQIFGDHSWLILWLFAFAFLIRSIHKDSPIERKKSLEDVYIDLKTQIGVCQDYACLDVLKKAVDAFYNDYYDSNKIRTTIHWSDLNHMIKESKKHYDVKSNIGTGL